MNEANSELESRRFIVQGKLAFQHNGLAIGAHTTRNDGLGRLADTYLVWEDLLGCDVRQKKGSRFSSEAGVAFYYNSLQVFRAHSKLHLRQPGVRELLQVCEPSMQVSCYLLQRVLLLNSSPRESSKQIILHSSAR